MVTGDGDGLSIGGNHLLHVIRRNVNLQILLFNNEIYGLTKGQYSPTSRIGTRSPSSPKGSVDSPVNPCAFALGAGAKFVARGVDTSTKTLVETLKAAHAFDGAAFVEIFQNCIVYNADVFSDFTEKKVSDDQQIHLEHGKPMLFAGGRKGLRFDPHTYKLEVVAVGDGGVAASDLLVHDENNRTLAHLLVEMKHPEFPVAMGVLYREHGQPSFDKAFWASHPSGGKRTAKVAGALRRGYVWTKKAS
jgi:2-oxoglutarate ferredoxin oxidoreductase subunit beta